MGYTHKAVLPIVVFMGILSFFQCKKASSQVVEQIQSGPFVIEVLTKPYSSFNMNTGRRVENPYIGYRLTYQGQDVPYPDRLESNTGVPGLWRVFPLEGTPVPSLIAASQNVFLITEENGACKVKKLDVHTSSFATLQWLDSEKGQPGAKHEIYVRSEPEKLDTLTGGRYLLVNEQMVLDITTLETWKIEKLSYKTEDYYSERLVAFSPAKKDLVFVGNRHNGEKYEYALCIYDFFTNEAYAVPFDQNQTRLHQTDQINTAWVDTFFEWQELSDSTSKLALKTLNKPQPWKGFYPITESYAIAPVGEGMFAIFIDFLKNHLQLSDADFKKESWSGKNHFVIDINEARFSIGYLEEQKQVYFEKSMLGNSKLKEMEMVREIGEAFNQLLGQGLYQDQFLSY